MLDGPCWFLIALFYCKIFMDVCILKKRIGILALAVLFFVLCMHVHRYLFMANSVMAMPFYGLGYVYKGKLLAVAKIKHPLVLSLFTFCIALLIMLINGSVSMWSVLFGAFGNFSIPLFLYARICWNINDIVFVFHNEQVISNNNEMRQFSNKYIRITSPVYFLIR